jgi:hypothetical protein
MALPETAGSGKQEPGVVEYWSNGNHDNAHVNGIESLFNTPILQHSTDLTCALENLSVGIAHPKPG